MAVSRPPPPAPAPPPGAAAGFPRSRFTGGQSITPELSGALCNALAASAAWIYQRVLDMKGTGHTANRLSDAEPADGAGVGAAAAGAGAAAAGALGAA